MQPLVGESGDGAGRGVVEAMRKAAVAWIELSGRPPRLVWCAWLEDALFVVSGAGEQAVPGLDRAGSATVTARGDHGGAIVAWPAIVTRLHPGSADWDRVVPQLAAKRLNGRPAADLATGWAGTATVSRLAPA